MGEEFYFAVFYASDEWPNGAIICPVDYFNDRGCQYDQHLGDRVCVDGMDEIAESIFEIDDSVSVPAMHDRLANQPGFRWSKKFADYCNTHDGGMDCVYYPLGNVKKGRVGAVVVTNDCLYDGGAGITAVLVASQFDELLAVVEQRDEDIYLFVGTHRSFVVCEYRETHLAEDVPIYECEIISSRQSAHDSYTYQARLGRPFETKESNDGD